MGKSLKSFFVVIFILLLEFCSLSLLFLIPFQHAFHKDNIKEVVLKSTSDHLEENNLLSDIIHERLNSATSGGKQEEIKEDVMQKLMESDEMRELAASIVGNISDYIITGKEQSVITEEELKKIVADAIDTINKGGYYTISEEEKGEYLKKGYFLLDSNGKEIKQKKVSDKQLTELTKQVEKLTTKNNQLETEKVALQKDNDSLLKQVEELTEQVSKLTKNKE